MMKTAHNLHRLHVSTSEGEAPVPHPLLSHTANRCGTSVSFATTSKSGTTRLRRSLLLLVALVMVVTGCNTDSVDTPDSTQMPADAGHDTSVQDPTDAAHSDDTSVLEPDADPGDPPESFPLHINDVAGLDAPWPLLGGVPFPEGVIHDESQIRIVGEGGEIPAQIDVAIRWLDGSIRWALVGFVETPQSNYRVEYGPNVERQPPQVTLGIETEADGRLTVDTGAAVFEFPSDQLLMDRVTMGDEVVLEGSGDGVYLIDNLGRTARVSGPNAQVETQIEKQGPRRAVIQREGWYVTEDGEQIARAQVWFYVSAESPYVRITHSLVFTEDTNDTWIRDYGLEFKTPSAPAQLTFPHRSATETELAPLTPDRDSRNMSVEEIQPFSDLFTGPPVEEQLFTTEFNGQSVYMLQDDYPHFREREARASIGREAGESGGNDEVLHDPEVVGDWADAAYTGHGLTLVVPWLAQQFPKDISFAADRARVALWSQRSGRELDFRAATLVDEYWQSWAEYYEDGPGNSPEAAAELATFPSNAQGAARTQDIWFLPRVSGDDAQTIQKRAHTAARPPLLQADFAWVGASEAIGWPMHPKDEQNFGEVEDALTELWHRIMMTRHSPIRRTGLLAWGLGASIQNSSRFFRVGIMPDYYLRRHVWGLYARSGERRYYDYAVRWNRFIADWNIANYDTPDKVKGLFVDIPIHEPFWWHGESMLSPRYGPDVSHWLFEYLFTGNERALRTLRHYGDAYKDRWPEESGGINRWDGVVLQTRVMATLYSLDFDEAYKNIAQEILDYVIDLDSLNGINDDIRFGALYKMDRNLISFYLYDKELGSEPARQALLKGVDYLYRFNYVSGPYGGQNYSAFLFSIAYQWTGNPAYLRVVNHIMEGIKNERPGVPNITNQVNPTTGAPVAMQVLSGVNREELAPFPLAETDTGRFRFTKNAGESVRLSVFVRLSDDVDETTPLSVNVEPLGDGNSDAQTDTIQVTTQQSIDSHYTRTDLRRWHAELEVPAELPAGEYEVVFEDATTVKVLDAEPVDVSLQDQE